MNGLCFQTCKDKYYNFYKLQKLNLNKTDAVKFMSNFPTLEQSSNSGYFNLISWEDIYEFAIELKDLFVLFNWFHTIKVIRNGINTTSAPNHQHYPKKMIFFQINLRPCWLVLLSSNFLWFPRSIRATLLPVKHNHKIFPKTRLKKRSFIYKTIQIWSSCWRFHWLVL